VDPSSRFSSSRRREAVERSADGVAEKTTVSLEMGGIPIFQFDDRGPGCLEISGRCLRRLRAWGSGGPWRTSLRRRASVLCRRRRVGGFGADPPAGRNEYSSSSVATWDNGKTKVIDILTSADLASPVFWYDETDQAVFLQQVRPCEVVEKEDAAIVVACSNMMAKTYCPKTFSPEKPLVFLGQSELRQNEDACQFPV
jgi:hypothetical protein